MDDFVVPGIVLALLSVGLGFGYANNVADNNAILDLVSKGSPVLEAKCAIRPNVACDTLLALKAAK